jgi:hypothetical protein
MWPLSTHRVADNRRALDAEIAQQRGDILVRDVRVAGGPDFPWPRTS